MIRIAEVKCLLLEQPFMFTNILYQNGLFSDIRRSCNSDVLIYVYLKPVAFAMEDPLITFAVGLADIIFSGIMGCAQTTNVVSSTKIKHFISL